MRFQGQKDKGKAVKKDNRVHFSSYKFQSSAGFMTCSRFDVTWIKNTNIYCNAKLDLPFTSTFSWMILRDV